MSTTPNRTTKVTLDRQVTFQKEPPFLTELRGPEVQPAGDATVVNGVVIVPGVGWRLDSYQGNQSYKHERSGADSFALTPANGNATVATGLLEIDIHRANTDLTGVSLGPQRVSGDKYLQKSVSASGSFNSQLTSDASAFPGPDGSDDSVPMDRVFLGSDAHAPDQTITFTFWPMPATGLHAYQRIGRVYFSSLAGTKRNESAGTGQYALTLWGDGNAELAELLADGTWKSRRILVWSPPSQVAGNSHTITITSDATLDINGRWQGTKILFQFQSASNPIQAGIQGLENAAFGPMWVTYQVPRHKAYVAPSLSPIRADIRRDIRAMFQFHVARYWASGILFTATFNLANEPFDLTKPIQFQAFGDIPSDTSVELAMYSADGTALAVADTGGSSIVARWKSFTPIAGKRAYYGKITWNSNGAYTKTPTVQYIRIIREQSLGTLGPTVTVPDSVLHVSHTGQDSDPSHETAGLYLSDPGDALTLLRTRARMPVSIDVYYDPDDVTAHSRIFEGYVLEAKATRRGSKVLTGGRGSSAQWPKEKWSDYQLRCAGEWLRLKTAQAPKRIFLTGDPAAAPSGQNLGYKVSDIVRALLGWCGYSSSEIDVPDISVRYFFDGAIPASVEPFTELAPFIIALVRDYLGGYLVWDANAGARGKWRVKIPPRPVAGVYKNLAEFVLGPNWSGSRSVAYYKSYGSTTVGGQVVQKYPVWKDSFTSHVVPPEANIIYMAGAIASETENGSLTRGSFVRGQNVAVNWKSADFGQNGTDHPSPDPNHPDYLGYPLPLYIGDPGLNSANAINFALRRTYDLCAHAQLRIQFAAPLVLVTDVTDTSQTRPRPLMFGDPVKVDGEQFIVASANADYEGIKGGDRFQHCAYEVFSVPSLSDYSEGMMPNVLGRTD